MARRSWRRGRGAVRKVGMSWYIRFSQGGKRREEKVPAKSKSEAETCLRTRLHQLDKGEFNIATGKVRVTDLFEDIKRDYRLKGQREEDLTKRWIHLSPVFGQCLAREVSDDLIARYIEQRLAEKAEKATIQRELSCLRRMYRLARKKIHVLPTFPTLHVDNARKGFFEEEDFVRMRQHLPAHLQILATMAYWTGWRKGELLQFQWKHLDLQTGEARLEPSMTKTREGRVIFLPVEALEALRAWRQTTEELERKTQRIINHVFHFNGHPIKDFLGSWRVATKTAGVPGMLFHDLRRTSVRNYVRSGVPERVAMSISGHKTRSIFERYNIVSPRDLQEAASKVSSSQNGEIMGKIIPLTGGGRHAEAS